MRPLIYLTLTLISVVTTATGRDHNDAQALGFQDCFECPPMVLVPAGTYLMGSPEDEVDRDPNESPIHSVTFANPFAIGKTEVTNDQFAVFVEATGHKASENCMIWDGSELLEVKGHNWRNPSFDSTSNHPVVCVSWHDAMAYVRWLSEKTGQSYRLPSESEWEYVARAGKQGDYPVVGAPDKACLFGNVADISAQREVAHWRPADCDDGVGFRTAEVMSYQPNEFGLFDTLGNVWEWVADCYYETYDGAPPNGEAWGPIGSCDTYLNRGGSFYSDFPGNMRPCPA